MPHGRLESWKLDMMVTGRQLAQLALLCLSRRVASAGKLLVPHAGLGS